MNIQDSDMTRFVLLRHGQSQGNIDDIVLGTLESPLTPKGITDAESRVEDVRSYAPTHFYSSPIGRAQETCHVIMDGLGVTDFQIDARLRERFVGARLQGVKQDEAVNLVGEERESFEKMTLSQKLTHHFCIAPDAETPFEADARIVSFIKDVGKAHVGEVIFCVTHAAALSSFLAPRGAIAFTGIFGGDAIPNLGMFIVDYYQSTDRMVISAK